ncbi:MAG TPA: hypothetical protein VGM78_10970 [Ilumatobacteraceae bacterium]
MTTDDRIEQFKTQIAELQVKTTGRASTERATSILGIVLMVAAIVVGIGSYVQSGKEVDPRDQTDLVILCLTCITVALVGAALWIRTAVVRFWRFWMLRSLYEGQAHIDEVVKAIKERG